MWLFDLRCGERVKATWTNTGGSNTDSYILKRVAMWERDLTWWNHNCFGNVRRELEEKKKQLVSDEAAAMVSGNNLLIWILKTEIIVLLDRESKMWNQRSRVLWLSKGDNNTKYFHSKATKRFQMNTIMGIWDSSGRWLDQTVDIGQSFIRYYTELFSSSNPPRVQEALHTIPKVAIESMNANLVGTFHEWEVLEALKQMAPLKVPGPDGICPLFYQHFWPVVDHDVTNSILYRLNTGTSTCKPHFYCSYPYS